MNRYKCSWCHNKFEQEVRTSEGEKHSKYSDQVICPKCSNFVKTFEEEKEKI